MPAPSKHPLIFVPGLGATGETYAPFLKDLRTRYDVRIAELPRAFPEKLSWQFFFSPIEAAAAGAEKFMLLGHSLGGNTALAYAARFPDRVAKVVTVGAPVLPKKGIGVRGLARFRIFRRLQNFALGLLGANPRHALRAIRIRSEQLAGERRRALYDWINHTDLRPELGKLRNATVLWAAKEEVLAPEHFEEIRRHSNIAARIIPGSHNNLALNPRPIKKIIYEALGG